MKSSEERVSDMVAQAQIEHWERVGYPKVFINYRSRVENDVDAANLIYNSIGYTFGLGKAFMASRCIPPGGHFEQVINAALAKTEVIVPMIGRRWAASLPTIKGRQRGHPWVVHELKTAMEAGQIVLPVMVINGRRIRGNIPEEIAGITNYQTMPCPLENAPPEMDYARCADDVAWALGTMVPGLWARDLPAWANWRTGDTSHVT